MNIHVSNFPCKARLGLTALASFALAASSMAAVLYNNGPLITRTGVGSGGADVSEVQTSLLLNTYGFGHQQSAGNRVADDFTPTGAGWHVTGFTFWGYQTNSGITSTINHVNVRIWDGPPKLGTSLVIAGDTTTNVMTATVFSRIYRILDTDNAGTTVSRPVMKQTVVLGTAVDLVAGHTYWVDWQSGGSSSFSGPWCPPVTIVGQTGKPGANSEQYTMATLAWADLFDAGANAAQDLPFEVNGTQLGGGVDIPPTDFTFFRGVQESGDLSSLAISDDNYLVARNGVTALRTESPITLRVSSVSPLGTPTNFGFKVENHVSITGLTQRTDLFDYVAGSYENEDTRSATTTDSVVQVAGTSPARFVETGTNAIKSQVRIRADGPVFTNTWRSFFDQTVWQIS